NLHISIILIFYLLFGLVMPSHSNSPVASALTYQELHEILTVLHEGFYAGGGLSFDDLHEHCNALNFFLRCGLAGERYHPLHLGERFEPNQHINLRALTADFTSRRSHWGGSLGNNPAIITPEGLAGYAEYVRIKCSLPFAKWHVSDELAEQSIQAATR